MCFHSNEWIGFVSNPWKYLKEIFKGYCCLLFNYQGSFYCSFQATAFIFYQKLFSLSRTFLFFLLLVSCSMASLWQLIYVITSELLCQPLFNDSYKLLLISLMNHSIELPLDQGLSVSTPSSLSEVVLWFSVPFSATKIILS